MRNLLRLPVLSLVACAMFISGTARAGGDTTTSKLEGFWYKAYEAATKLIEHKDYEWAKYDWKVIAKAGVDECYYGIGDARNLPSFYATYPNDFTQEQIEACKADEGHPKVNQAYVWGLTKTLGRIWAGTLSNTHCLVQSSFYGPESPFPPIENDSWVCEMGANGNNDFRAPRIFIYDVMQKKYTDLTQTVIDAGPVDEGRLKSTIGLRSAGTFNGVVFIAGVAFNGVNMFAFDAVTTAYLGSMSYPDFENIRQWRVILNQLYVGVGVEGGGQILRWTGDVSDPFQFEVVGNVGGDPAYITWHAGRIFSSTWPSGVGSEAAVWMSPLKGEDKMLTSADADGWQRVWTLSDYEVERASVKGGGAIKSFDGWLYWGTMDVPGTGVYYFSLLYGDEPVGIETHLGTYRPVTIFRGKNFGQDNQEIELLYGNEFLPKFDRGDPNVEGDGQWTIVPNNMGQKPKYGLAGFGNYFNNYTWWMEVFDDNLFVGTMDHLYLLGAAVGDELQVPDSLRQLAQHFYGADLWRFPRGDHPAIPVSISGVGNYSNYGVRTMVVGPDHLYLGMANPMNLLTDPNDGKPEGGWELIKLWRRPDKDGDGIPDGDDKCPAYANDDIGDPCCQDEDKDGVADLVDACPFDPNDAVGDGCNHDEDGDNILDGVDACPFDAVHDAIGDACNHDEDGDKILDGEDDCPFDAVHDAIGDACNHDEDGDKILDGEDACPFDAVHDGFGDPCDHDEDGDGVFDDDDACPEVAAATADGCVEEVTDDGSDDGTDGGEQPSPSKSETTDAGSPMGCSSTGSGPGAMLGLLLMGMLLWRPRRTR